MTDKNQNIRIIFGRNVRKYRKALKLNQGELGDLIGYAQNSVSAMETGGFMPDDEDILAKIASALKVEVSQLTSIADNLDIISVPHHGSSQSKSPDLLGYLDQLERSGSVPIEILNNIKTYVLLEKEELIDSYRRYNDLREKVKKKMGLDI